MTPHFPEEFSTRLIHWSSFVIMGNTMPPRDPDEDEEDKDEDEEEEEEDQPTNLRSCASRTKTRAFTMERFVPNANSSIIGG